MAREQPEIQRRSDNRLYGVRTASIRYATVLIAATYAISACGSDSSGPDPVTISFDVQPSASEAGTPIQPGVEVVLSSSAQQTVSLSIAGDRCGASLSGQTSKVSSNGVAVFSDIAVDIPTGDYRLEARVLDWSALSAPFDVLAPEIAGPLEQHPTLCLKDRPVGDASSLTWVSSDDVMWTADDNRNKLCGLDRRSGVCLNEVTSDDLIQAFPGAADCDDGDGNPSTSCSYTNELEVVAYDDKSGFLYVFNTVNDPSSEVILDRPAVFRLRRGTCRACVEYDSWQELPPDYTYRAAVAVDGKIYISNGPFVHLYDFDENSVTEEPALPSAGSTITGLSFWPGVLYILTRSPRLATVDWDEGEFEDSFDLDPIGVRSANGVEVVRDTVYVLEGEPRNPIYIVTIDPTQP